MKMKNAFSASFPSSRKRPKIRPKMKTVATMGGFEEESDLKNCGDLDELFVPKAIRKRFKLLDCEMGHSG